MAISKVILNGTTLMDVTTDTVAADKLLSSYTATKNDGTKITGTLQASSLKTAQGYSTYNSNNYLWTLTFSNLTNSPHTFFLMPNTPNLAAGTGYTFYGTQFATYTYYYVVIAGSYDGTNSAFYAVNSNANGSGDSYYIKLLDNNFDSTIVSWSYSNGTLTMTCPNSANIQGQSNLGMFLISIGQITDGTTPADYILYYT